MNLLKSIRKFVYSAAHEKHSHDPSVNTLHFDHDYFADVAEASGWSYDEARKDMETVRDQLGVPYEVYYRDGYYTFSRSRQERRAEIWCRKNAREQKAIRKMASAVGCAEEKICSDIAALNDRNDVKTEITAYVYKKYGLFKLDSEAALSIVHQIDALNAKAEALSQKLSAVDNGTLTYADIQGEIEDYYTATRLSITPYYRTVLVKRFGRLLSSLDADEDKTTDIITDAEVCHNLLNFNYGDYKMYHLHLFPFPEKREFVSDLDRRRIPNRFNNDEIFDLLSNKYYLYQKMPELFGRDMAAIYSNDDFDTFARFVIEHGEFVCKPFSSSIGRGVSLITVEDPQNRDELKKLFDRLLKENRIFIMEERIYPAESMAAFNHDSINTVRVIAMYTEEVMYPVGAFFRTGRAGSFVDNGGAGGIFASIDCRTGIVETDGGDEKGLVYPDHPDSHISFKGFRIPEWDQALSLVTAACKIMGEKCYIGWDLALTSDNKWIIVEGNGRSTYLHQGPLFHGVRPQLMKLVHQYGSANDE